jgi:hypothetical protein
MVSCPLPFWANARVVAQNPGSANAIRRGEWLVNLMEDMQSLHSRLVARKILSLRGD